METGQDTGEVVQGVLRAVDNQDAQICARLGGGAALRFGVVECVRQLHGEIKGAAEFRRAFGPNVTVHEVHEALGDGKTKTGAAVLAGYTAVGLFEREKKFATLRLCETDATVPHSDLNRTESAVKRQSFGFE